MRPVTIPIRSLMPEPDDGVAFMPMPREMSTFEMPRTLSAIRRASSSVSAGRSVCEGSIVSSAVPPPG